MKLSIQKVLLAFICFCVGIWTVKADCSSSERVQLNTQASYITYDYSYNEKDKTFNIHIYNLTSYLQIEYNSDYYYAKKEETIIKNIEEGSRVFLLVQASRSTNCSNTTIRTINYQVPYTNPYLDSVECELYPEVNICNTKYLPYKLTNAMFKRTFNAQKDKLISKNEEEQVTEETWLDVLKEYALKYGMQSGLTLAGTLSMLILGRKAVKRAQAKF